MKKNFSLTIAAWLAFCLLGVMDAYAQRMILPSNLVGVNLKEIQKEYLRHINRGQDTLLPSYADALYYDGQIIKAFEMYSRADSLEVPLSKNQQRNFVHAGKRLGRSSSYDQSTAYFSRDLNWQAEVSKYAVNSEAEDFAPFTWGNLLFLTSSRVATDRRDQDRYVFTQLPFLAVYAFDKDRRLFPVDFLPALNTSLHDGPLAISADTSLLVITRNYARPNDDQLQNLFMEYYVREGGNWQAAQAFQFNDPAYSVQHPFFDDSSSTLYFSSDMPGGLGGFDLYSTVWDGTAWSAPNHLGSEINSPYDEVFPVICPSGGLYYTSNHIETYGGLDLVLFRDDKRILLPEPFNTVYDDLSITFAGEAEGYFASNRNQSVFNDDIYSYRITPYPFVVRVLARESKIPLQDVSVAYKAEIPDIDGIGKTSPYGELQIHIGYEDPFNVHLSISRDGYVSRTLTTSDFVFRENRWELTVYMDPVSKEQYFVLYFDNDYPDPGSEGENTEYTYDETFALFSGRRPEFYERSASDRASLDVFFREVDYGREELERMAEAFYEGHREGHRFSIMFTSHASPLASDEYNLNLSKRRFHAVENFLLTWREGSLVPFIEAGMLHYENNPYGSRQADPSVSEDPAEPEKSIYSVEASRERKITVTWRKIDGQ